MAEIYFDNAATTKIDERVFKKMQPFLKEDYGNPSSAHEKGEKARREIEEARKIIAKSINADEKEIYFTSGGTEANNWALKGMVMAYPNQKHIITTKIEHPSVLDVCKVLKNENIKTSYIEVDEKGFVNLKQLEREITKKTLLVSVIHGNNEIGVIQDLEKIGKICRKNGIFFHVDACQSFLKTELNVKKQGIDLLTLNSHKIHGPKGIGCLFIREGISISPLINGGGQERKMRSGTENTAGIAGFGAAVSFGLKEKKKNNEKMKEMQANLIKEILKIPNVKINGPLPGKERLCNNINISFKNIEGEAVMGFLNEEKIYVSTGSACSSHKLEPSYVLTSIGLSELEANTSIRISLSKFNTKEETEIFIKKLKVIVNKLREISPFN